MEKEEMIKAIYKKVADKTLNFGCKIKGPNKILHPSKYMVGKYPDKDLCIIIGGYGNSIKNGLVEIFSYEKLLMSDNYKKEVRIVSIIDLENNYLIEIIGHPVMIGDVLDYIENQDGNKGLRSSGGLDETYWVYDETLFDKWEEKRKPIEEQSLDCITYIYNLIS